MEKPNDFLIRLIDLTRDYVAVVRRDDSAQFHWREEGGAVKAKFDYGREAEGDFVGAACEAIGNAIRAIDTMIEDGSSL